MGKKPPFSDYVFVGIDPGKTGAAAALFSNRAIKPLLFPFANKTPWDIYEFFGIVDRSAIRSAPIFYLIEKVAGSTGGIQGRTSGRSMFTFGWNAGFLYGLLVEEQLAEITPAKWQKEFGLIRTNKKEKDGDKKRRHASKAQKLFPQQKVTQQIADALLLATYCRRHYEELF